MLNWPVIVFGGGKKPESVAKDGAEQGLGAQPLNDGADAGLTTEGNPNLLALSDFSDCSSPFRAFSQHAQNYLLRDPEDARRCAAGIGANHVTSGKLVTPQFSLSRDVWMSGYVYFPADFQLPAVSSDFNGVCYGGVHLWRMHQSMETSGDRISVDINVPAGLDVLQLYVIRDNGAATFFKNTAFKPARLKGRWQFWQVHVHLGTPGKSDGYVRFYADRKFVDSMERQPFLPSQADASWGFSYVDVQSNIGGCSAHWPVQNGWLVGNVRVCRDSLC
jgi:hypothetical protein